MSGEILKSLTANTQLKKDLASTARPKHRPAGEPYSVLREIERHPGLMSPEALAKILGTSRKTIYIKVKKGLIPSCNRGGGGQVKFDPCTLAYWYRKLNPVAARADQEM